MRKADFYKYFVNTKNDLKAGIHIENIGNSIVQSGVDYPVKDHPDSHYFKWEKGRFLKEYQLLYISEGKGIFESASAGKHNLIPGSIFLIFPNEWHRYRPSKTTGWEEYWIGFNGKFSDRIISNSPFTPEKPIHNVSNCLLIQELFKNAIIYGKEEKPGYQQIISGLVLQIFGHIQLAAHSVNFEGKPIEDKIDKARIILNESINADVNLTSIAKELNISYSLFRKRFKEYTGVSPKHYFLQLKMKRAQDLLLNTSLPVKSIAFETGFENLFHFSKSFKEKTGYSPTEYRKAILFNPEI